MPDDNEYLMYSEAQIVSLLNGLMKSHQLISVFPENTAASNISVVTHVLESDKCFMLDAVRDPVIHKRIAGGSAFTFETSIDGVKLQSPRLRIVDTVGDSDDLRYQISIPPRMYYFQRREAFRAAVPALVGVQASVQLSNPVEDQAPTVFDGCDLINISATGCALSMMESGGEIVSECNEPVLLRFAFEEWEDCLEVSAVKMHHHFLERVSRWQFGFHFIDLPPKTRHQIDRLVAKIQQVNRQSAHR